MDANQPIALVLSSCSRALNIQHEILWEPKTSEVSCLGKATAVVRLNYSVQKTINTVVGKSRPSKATGSEPRSLRERFIVEVKKNFFDDILRKDVAGTPVGDGKVEQHGIKT